MIQPAPLEPSPEYFTLSSQRNSLAVLHASSALLPHNHFANLSPILDLSPAHDSFPDDDITDLWLAENASVTPFRTPAPQPSTPSRAALFTTPLPRVSSAASARPLFTTPRGRATPSRLQTLDQLADDGLMGAVVFLGDERTPEYADQKRKARESAFKGVTPATAGGPLSFYNGGAPKKRAKVASQFKTPFLPASSAPSFQSVQAAPSLQLGQAGPSTLRGQPGEPLFLPGPSQFDEPESSAPPARLPPDALAVRPAPLVGRDREAALAKLREALLISFESGDLAHEVLQHWDRREAGDKR